MAIPLRLILRQRAACPVHLQAEVLDIEPPERWPGAATMWVRVAQVFRGSLPKGETIVLRVETFREGDPFPSGDFLYAWSGLRAARFIEVCLERTGDDLRLPSNSCSTILGGLTQAPVLELPTARPSLGRRLWTRLSGWLVKA